MGPYIHWDGNTITCAGELNRSDAVRRVTAGLHQIIEVRGYLDLTLDFRGCSVVTETVMLPLMPIIVRYREVDNVTFKIELPDSPELYRLFTNTNWGYFVDPSRFSEITRRNDQIPAQRFAEPSAMGQLVSDFVTLVLKRSEVDRDTLHTVEWSLNEIMDNVITHSESEVGGFVQATAFENRVEFVVADAGIGIPASLGIRNPEHALRSAIEEGHTRNSESNAGNGLFGSYRAASLSNSQFEIFSYNGLLFYDRNRELAQTRYESVPFMGTSVRCGIGLTDPDLLKKALRFSGVASEPTGYIEIELETDEGNVVVSVKERAAGDTGSRAGGIRFRRLIENLLRDQPTVTLDFVDVPVVSSSFADEVFGRLFVNLGPRTFMSRILITNANQTVNGLIDRAIVQRTQLSRTE
jgi:anti-sigma regulatory factor (Ser/Thr protein kinase)